MLRLVIIGIGALIHLITAEPSAAANLFINGNFSLGNVGFATNYTYSPGDVGLVGTYDIVTSPNLSHGDFASFGDHTQDASALMMIANAATDGRIVWSQSVLVAPNTTYQFSAWATSACCLPAGFDHSPAHLVLQVNGASVDGGLNVIATSGIWHQLIWTIDSGLNTSLAFALLDSNTAGSGNDFALDDITLAAAVPLPAAFPLFATGLAGLGWLARRRRKQAA